MYNTAPTTNTARKATPFVFLQYFSLLTYVHDREYDVYLEKLHFDFELKKVSPVLSPGEQPQLHHSNHVGYKQLFLEMQAQE